MTDYNLPDTNDWAALRDSGLLWLINQIVFHPRGFQLVIKTSGYDDAPGWYIEGNGATPLISGWEYSAEQSKLAEAYLDRHRPKAPKQNAHLVPVLVLNKADGTNERIDHLPLDTAIRLAVNSLGVWKWVNAIESPEGFEYWARPAKPEITELNPVTLVMEPPPVWFTEEQISEIVRKIAKAVATNPSSDSKVVDPTIVMNGPGDRIKLNNGRCRQCGVDLDPFYIETLGKRFCGEWCLAEHQNGLEPDMVDPS